MLYSHDSTEDPKVLAATREHVIAHLSSVCSWDDDEEEYAHEVEVSMETLPNDMVRITGFIGREPYSPYTHPQDAPRGLAISGVSLATRIQAGLTKYGIPWRVLDGADRRGNGQSWGDVRGGIMHHTATGFGKAPSVLWVGRPDLSPPLCNTAGEADGTVAFVAYHPGNHAGASGGKSMGPLPKTRSFNRTVWGHEIVYPGIVPMTPQQYVSAVVLGKVIAEVLGVNAEHIRAHGETSITGKWDPGTTGNRMIDMAAFRRAINEVGDDVALTQADKDWIWENMARRVDVGHGRDQSLEAVRQVSIALAGMNAKVQFIAERGGAVVDVDEQQIADAILRSMTPLIRSAVLEALGEDNQDQADKILDALGAKLAS